MELNEETKELFKNLKVEESEKNKIMFLKYSERKFKEMKDLIKNAIDEI